MKVLFIAAGPLAWGSSRMRAWWVAEEMGVDCVQFGQPIAPDYDVYIWQKSVSLETIKSLPNARHYWDVCDPSWWWRPDECHEIVNHMMAVIASSEALADDFNDWDGRDLVTCIPDRLKLSHFHTQRQHKDVSPVRFIWFGVAVNRVALYGAIANLERLAANGHKIELTIYDNAPDVRFPISQLFPIYHSQWAAPGEVDTLASHDIALLPPYPGAWGKVKSNNKTLTAWACGLPTCDGVDYGHIKELVCDSEARMWQATAGRMTLEDEYTIDKSAAEWVRVLT